MHNYKFILMNIIGNIPHIVMMCVFYIRANRIKKEKAYILLVLLLISMIVFLEDIAVITPLVRLLLVCFVWIVFALPFINEGKLRAFVYNVSAYIISLCCELVMAAIIYLMYGDGGMERFFSGMVDTIWIKVLSTVFTALAEYTFFRFWQRRYRKDYQGIWSGTVFSAAFIELLFAYCICLIIRMDYGRGVVMLVVVAVFSEIILIAIAFGLLGQSDKRRRAELTAYYLDRLSESQLARKRELSEDIEKSKKLRENILKSLKAAESFLTRRQSVDAYQCIDRLLDNLSAKYRYSNHKVADVVLSEKARLCEKAGIAFSSSFALSEDLCIDGAALCVILSNLLDNAIRACMGRTPCSDKDNKSAEDAKRRKSEGGQAYITITAKIQAGYLVISQENSFYGEPERRRQGAFSRHGLGFEILKSIADSHNGQLRTEYDREMGKFVTNLIVKNV